MSYRRKIGLAITAIAGVLARLAIRANLQVRATAAECAQNLAGDDLIPTLLVGSTTPSRSPVLLTMFGHGSLRWALVALDGTPTTSSTMAAAGAPNAFCPRIKTSQWETCFPRCPEHSRRNNKVSFLNALFRQCDSCQHHQSNCK